MDKQDKTWLWLTVISFVSIAIAILFWYLEYKELTDPVTV